MSKTLTRDGFTLCHITDKDVWIWAAETEAGGIRIMRTAGEHGERLGEDRIPTKETVEEHYLIYKTLIERKERCQENTNQLRR